tara:strand:+ start:304 stop:717 length:414 start_codon:yes stop_codon:yes gene_type:complete
MLWLFLCSLAIAQDDVITLQKDEKAPFAGTLLSPDAAARLLAKGEADLATCIANAERDKAILTAEKDFEIQTIEAKLAKCTFESVEKEKLYLERIDWLEKRTNPPSWQGPILFGGGIVIGMATVALSAWTLDKIQEN